MVPTPIKQIKRIQISGAVSLENWTDIFRCFIGPVNRMNLRRLRLGIDFEMEMPEEQPLDENDNTLKAMKESANQLGLKMEAE
jgi:hypothetical protein